MAALLGRISAVRAFLLAILFCFLFFFFLPKLVILFALCRFESSVYYIQCVHSRQSHVHDSFSSRIDFSLVASV